MATYRSSSENLPPRTLARVAREVRDLHKNPPEGVRLIDQQSLGEVVVSLCFDLIYCTVVYCLLAQLTRLSTHSLNQSNQPNIRPN